MNAFEVYEKYLALKGHFAGRYDYNKYKGKVNVKVSTFEKRRDKYYFKKVAKQYNSNEVVPFLLSNFVDNEDAWIGELANNQDSDKIFLQWKKRTEGMTYLFKEEFKKTLNFLSTENLTFSDMFKVEGANHPLLFVLLMQKELSIETFIIMNEVLGFIKIFDGKLKHDIVWESWSEKCKHYRKFLEIDEKNFKELMVSIINSSKQK